MDQNNCDTCGIVQDLLPLYCDDACSPASRRVVKDHLRTCEKCRQLYKELQDNTIDEMIQKESGDVIKRHAQKEKRAAYKAGLIIALILMIPVIITFLVSVSTGSGFGVFGVLLSSMLLIGALTVVPLTSSHNKLLRSIGLGILSLLMIMFFVDRMEGGGNFILWSVPTVFGLSIFLFPIAIRDAKLPPALSNKKALIMMIWDTAWLYLTIFTVCNYAGDSEGMREGFIVASVMMSGAWMIFLFIRYLQVNCWIKAGISTVITSIWLSFAGDMCTFLIENRKQLTITSADFSDWEDTISLNANILLLILIIGGLMGTGMLAAGFVKRMKKNKK